VRTVALLPGGGQALSTSLDGTLRLWDLAAGTALAAWPIEPRPLCALATSDGRTLVVGTAAGPVQILQLVADPPPPR